MSEERRLFEHCRDKIKERYNIDKFTEHEYVFLCNKLRIKEFRIMRHDLNMDRNKLVVKIVYLDKMLVILADVEKCLILSFLSPEVI